MIVKVVEQKMYCECCDHTWIQRRDELPRVCPVCKRSDWNESNRIMDLTIPIESSRLEMNDVNALQRFEKDYGMPLEHYLRYNK